MADSILCSINMAGGAINIYYDTILAQGILNAGGSTSNTSIPSGWKVVIILSASYSNSTGNIQDALLAPYPIFTDTSNYLYMLTYRTTNSTSNFNTFPFAYVNSNRLILNSYCRCSYIVAG